MTDRRKHRGPGPADAQLFGADALPRLRAAVEELSWLRGRGYALPSALALVGNRHQLRERQRLSVQRASCTDAERDARAASRVDARELRGRTLAIDGFNCVIAVEAALSGGPLMVGRDRAIRDLSSVHGSYRKVEETPRAIELLCDLLARVEPAEARWYFDAPVSNSGRIRALVLETAGARCSFDVTVELVPSADRVLPAPGRVVASGDSAVIDRAEAWVDLPAAIVRAEVTGAWILDLSDQPR